MTLESKLIHTYLLTMPVDIFTLSGSTNQYLNLDELYRLYRTSLDIDADAALPLKGLCRRSLQILAGEHARCYYENRHNSVSTTQEISKEPD